MQVSENIDFRQSRELGEIISVTLAFLLQNFKHLWTCIIYIAGPAILLTGLYSAFSQDEFREFQETMEFSALGHFYFITLFLTLITTTLLSATVYEYVALYVERGFDNFDLNDVWAGVRRNILKFFGASVVLGFVVFFGLMFCIVPGLYFAVIFSLTYMILVQEEMGVFEAMSRSKELVKGLWGFTAGVVIVLFLIQLVMGLLLTMPQAIVSAIANPAGVDGEFVSSEMRMLEIVTTLVTTVAYYLLYALPLVGFAFHYHNLLERGEERWA